MEPRRSGSGREVRQRDIRGQACREARRAPLAICGYHTVLARKEVLVQLDVDLVGRLDELAEAEGTSRSELLRRGARAVLEAADLAEADRELQEAIERFPRSPG